MKGCMLMSKVKQEYNAEEVLEEIISLARCEHDVAEFGINVANILYEHGCIPEAVYEILIGE